MPDIFEAPSSGEVRLTNELLRVHKMPRRRWSDEEAAELAREMTDALKTPYGTMELRPLQAVALCEIGMYGGLFGPLRCGMGKTLISLLAPVVAFAERPLLLVPAKLVAKTERDRRALAEHWRLPSFLRIMTYEWLGRVQAADALEAFLPDMVVADEFHKLANLRAAVTRRVRRHMNEHPDVKFVPMSGTMTKRSGHDYAHGARWALGPDRLFLPRRYDELELWCDALDERKGQVRRADPGALEILCNEEEKRQWLFDRRSAARSAFRRRMVDTPGVVASYESDIDATLTVSGVECAVAPAVDAAFERLRDKWELPDGRSVLPEGAQIKEGLGVYRHARELALEFYYIWDPAPPREWMDARRAWHQYVRSILKHSRTLDSPHQVALARPNAPELLAWRAIKPSFKPRTVPVWIDDSVLEFCAQWAEKNRGIVWTEHVCFGERLQKDYGLPYYGEEGYSAAGKFIDDHPPGETLVASINSNDEGRNLQAWSTALVTSAPANGKKWEQVLSRLHRDGQEADEVSFDVLVTCAEHAGAFWQSVSDCRYVEGMFGSPQKLLLAGTNVLTAGELAQRSGARWRK